VLIKEGEMKALVGRKPCCGRPSGENMQTILIADDHQEVRTALRSLLETNCGATCVEAVNGVDAVAKAAECEPDIIILDFSMPEMDGLEAARLLKSMDPDVPLFLLTSYHEPQVEAAAYDAGISRVFSKGENLTDFLTLVHDTIVLKDANASDSHPAK
jgi:CheY-like chemotaxis protein